ncbi:MAG TPA: hypothetical protein VIE89_14470 [Candidatus Binatia bacterium]|jgi:hypothetical protein
MKDSRAAQRTTKSVPNSISSRINDVLATKVTLMVGTMWAFYAFVIFGLTPLVWPEHEEQILYWSNFLQLIFLPVITVGTAILSRSTEARAVADHEMIRKEFVMLQQTHTELRNLLKEVGLNVEELLKRSGR